MYLAIAITYVIWIGIGRPCLHPREEGEEAVMLGLAWLTVR